MPQIKSPDNGWQVESLEDYFGLPFGDTLSRSPEGSKFRKAWDKRVKSNLAFQANEQIPYTYVYRIQNHKGQGPYSYKIGDYEGDDLDTYTRFWEEENKSHLTPREDGFAEDSLNRLNKENFNGFLKFGFKDLNQVKKYFSGSELKR